MVLIVGITGASGVIYGIRLLEVLSRQKKVETHLIISEAGEINIRYETDWKIEDVKALANFSYWGAPIFSTTYNERVPAFTLDCPASSACLFL